MRNLSFLLLFQQSWQDPFSPSNPCTVATFSPGSSPSQSSPCSLFYTRTGCSSLALHCLYCTSWFIRIYTSFYQGNSLSRGINFVNLDFIYVKFMDKTLCFILELFGSILQNYFLSMYSIPNK